MNSARNQQRMNAIIRTRNVTNLEAVKRRREVEQAVAYAEADAMLKAREVQS